MHRIDHARDPRTFAIIGAARAVHRQLGPGFLEGVYQDALALEFKAREIPFVQEAQMPVYYGDVRLDRMFRADFICFGGVIVELKAISSLGRPEQAQLANYLTATRQQVGLLLNFGALSLEYQRIIPWTGVRHRGEHAGVLHPPADAGTKTVVL